MNILDRFLNYVKIPTTSNEESNTIPSMKEQRILAQYLIDKLKSL